MMTLPFFGNVIIFFLGLPKPGGNDEERKEQYKEKQRKE